MAVSKVGPFTRDAAIAAVDLSDSLYLFVSKNAAGELVLPAAQDDNVVGVVYETAPAGGAVTFATAGTGSIVKVVAGAALAVNDVVAPNAAGRAIAATGAGVGQVRTGTTAAGQIAEIYFRPVAAA